MTFTPTRRDGARWCRQLSLGLTLTAAGCTRSASSTVVPRPAIVATCASEHGTVSGRRQGAAYWEPVKLGSVFRHGDWVRTGELSSARVEFLNGGGLALEPKTILVIDHPPTTRPGQTPMAGVALEQGIVHGHFPEALSAQAIQPLRVRTADGGELTLASGGDDATDFRLERRNGKTEVTVLTGQVQVAVQGAVRSLSAGHYAEVGAAGLEGEAEELIPFPSSLGPGVDARFGRSKALEVELSWTQVAGASGYRLQVARDLSFQQLAVDEDLTSAQFQFMPAEVGTYAWRVASRDHDGRVGEFGFARRLYIEGSGGLRSSP